MSDCTCGRDGWFSPPDPDCPRHSDRSTDRVSELEREIAHLDARVVELEAAHVNMSWALEGTVSGAIQRHKLLLKNQQLLDAGKTDHLPRPRPAELREEDLQIVAGCDAAHPERRGGQHVAKPCGGVMVIHKPTGIAVRVDDARSQLQCKNAAVARLREVLAAWRPT